MSSRYATKCYVVQKADRDRVLGAVLAVKLTHKAAHTVAKAFAPAKVHFALADKSDQPNMELPLFE